MTKEFNLPSATPFDSIGGEPLEGSGFEDEEPDDGFDDGGGDAND